MNESSPPTPNNRRRRTGSLLSLTKRRRQRRLEEEARQQKEQKESTSALTKEEPPTKDVNVASSPENDIPDDDIVGNGKSVLESDKGNATTSLVWVQKDDCNGDDNHRKVAASALTLPNYESSSSSSSDDKDDESSSSSSSDDNDDEMSDGEEKAKFYDRRILFTQEDEFLQRKEMKSTQKTPLRIELSSSSSEEEESEECNVLAPIKVYDSTYTDRKKASFKPVTKSKVSFYKSSPRSPKTSTSPNLPFARSRSTLELEDDKIELYSSEDDGFVCRESARKRRHFVAFSKKKSSSRASKRTSPISKVQSGHRVISEHLNDDRCDIDLCGEIDGDKSNLTKSTNRAQLYADKRIGLPPKHMKTKTQVIELLDEDDMFDKENKRKSFFPIKKSNEELKLPDIKKKLAQTSLLDHNIFSKTLLSTKRKSQNSLRNDISGGSGSGRDAYSVRSEGFEDEERTSKSKKRSKKSTSGKVKKKRYWKGKRGGFWGKNKRKKGKGGRPTSTRSAWSGREAGVASNGYKGISRSDNLGGAGGANISF